MGGSDASTGPGGGGPALRAAGRRAGGASFTPCASRRPPGGAVHCARRSWAEPAGRVFRLGDFRSRSRATHSKAAAGQRVTMNARRRAHGRSGGRPSGRARPPGASRRERSPRGQRGGRVGVLCLRRVPFHRGRRRLPAGRQEAPGTAGRRRPSGGACADRLRPPPAGSGWGRGSRCSLGFLTLTSHPSLPSPFYLRNKKKPPRS